ncbi:hypothetical protein BZA77DRAFT_121025 [Pyronema omphalodes]|nr:hypothetical protein BZA77DRAFT_121025 [Pyronema omphalodes]
MLLCLLLIAIMLSLPLHLLLLLLSPLLLLCFSFCCCFTRRQPLVTASVWLYVPITLMVLPRCCGALTTEKYSINLECQICQTDRCKCSDTAPTDSVRFQNTPARNEVNLNHSPSSSRPLLQQTPNHHLSPTTISTTPHRHQPFCPLPIVHTRKHSIHLIPPP